MDKRYVRRGRRRRPPSAASGQSQLTRAYKTTATTSPRGGTRRRSTVTTRLRAGASSATRPTRPSCCWCRARTPARAKRWATCRCSRRRSDQPRVGRPGGGGVPRQLVDRDELLSQRVCARAQPFVDAFREQARATPDADSGLRNPAPRRRDPLPGRDAPTSCSRSRGSSSRPRSPRSTPSNGRRSCSTTSRCTSR